MKTVLYIVFWFVASIIMFATPAICSLGMYRDLVTLNPPWYCWVFPPGIMAGMTIPAWAFSGILFSCAWCEIRCAIYERKIK